MKTLAGSNSTLRSFRYGDEPSLAEQINNEKIYKPTLLIPYPYTLEDAKQWVERNVRLARQESPEELNFAIEVNGKAVGGIGLAHIVPGHKAEIGYWLGEEYWGRGIMTEAVKLLTQYALDELGLVRVYAGVFVWNKASQAVLKKAGFQLEGMHTKGIRKDGEFVDDYTYAKVR